MLLLDRYEIAPGKRLGPVGLALGAGSAAWVEWWLLRRSLRPTIGVVTVVAGAHLAEFGSIEDVAVAKAELVEAKTRCSAYTARAPSRTVRKPTTLEST